MDDLCRKTADIPHGLEDEAFEGLTKTGKNGLRSTETRIDHGPLT